MTTKKKPEPKEEAEQECKCHHCHCQVVYVPYPVTTAPYVPSYPSWWWTTPQIPQWTITTSGTTNR